ncbi:unnamed protein product [Auanema sp. JU1783]|nr:unnamed protein product [Auanema sp. JU1783]
MGIISSKNENDDSRIGPLFVATGKNVSVNLNRSVPPATKKDFSVMKHILCCKSDTTKVTAVKTRVVQVH